MYGLTLQRVTLCPSRSPCAGLTNVAYTESNIPGFLEFKSINASAVINLAASIHLLFNNQSYALIAHRMNTFQSDVVIKPLPSQHDFISS